MSIRLIVGPPGTGKTYSLVCAMQEKFKTDQPMVYSNMAGLKCPEYAYIEAAADFEHVSAGIVALDEVGNFFGSRDWQRRTKQQLTAFAQVRKDGLDLWCTTQHENRADTILRENCSEIWRCRRLGPCIVVQVLDPHSELKERRLGRRWFPLRSERFRLYDTLEKIDEYGRGGGRATLSAAVSTIARRREAARATSAAQQARQRSLNESIYRRGRRNLTMTDEAVEARRWLLEVRWGVCGESVPAVNVQAEVSRRRWLKVWGLTYEDVPVTCTRLNPWLLGLDPASVEARNDADRTEQAARDLIEGTKSSLRRERKTKGAI